MTLLSWRKEYEIGVATIDAEHRHLVGLANDFSATRAEGDSPGNGGKMLTRLIKYAEEHFQHEEQLMCENGYPRLDKHLAQHVDFVSNIFAVNEMIALNPAAASGAVLRFLKQWLFGHVLREDMDFADFLQRKTDQASKPQGRAAARSD